MGLAWILDEFRAWRDRRRALGELGKLQRRLAPIDDWVTDGQLEQARHALDRGDRAEAERMWLKASLSNPVRVRNAAPALKIVLELGRFDEAESLMTAGMKASPSAPYFHEGYAKVAQARGDYVEAIKRWERARRKFPVNPAPYFNPAACLKELGRVDEAEALLARAVRKFPDDFDVAVEHARLAEFRRDWPEAIRRWDPAYQRYSSCMAGLGIARGLQESGKLDEAEKLLRDLRFRFPTDPHPAIALARLAQARGDMAEALQRWALVQERFPLMLYGHLDGARALSIAGRPEEAEQVLSGAIDRFKDEPLPMVEYARIAHRKGDWPEADRRWQAVRARFPDRPEGYELGSEALAALNESEQATQLRAMWEARKKDHG